MESPFSVAPDTYNVPSYFPVPGLGFLPITWSLIRGREPVLVDTGMPIETEEFLKTLGSLIDPADLRWVVLTHDDNDHAGNAHRILELAPKARLVVNWLAAARMQDSWQLPMDRVYFVNPGQSIDVGDRRLAAVRPPLYDSPATLAIYDGKPQVLFGADSFGSIIPQPTPAAADVPQGPYSEGFNIFNRVLSPWVGLVDQAKFDGTLEVIRQLGATSVVSCHGPVAQGRTDDLLKAMSALPSMEPFVGPDQAALEAMMARMAGGGPPQGA